MISGIPDEESGDGFASKIEIASGVGDFVILSDFYWFGVFGRLVDEWTKRIEKQQKKEEGERVKFKNLGMYSQGGKLL